MREEICEPRLRIAQPGDAGALRDLMQASTRALGERYYSPVELEGAAQFFTEPDLDIISDGTFYAVEAGDELVACGGWSKRRKLFTGSVGQESLSGDLLRPGVDAARIRSFFVRADFARRGLGRLLFERCAADALAAGFDRFKLMATLAGVPFYERLGFVSSAAVLINLPDGSSVPCVPMARGII